MTQGYEATKMALKKNIFLEAAATGNIEQLMSLQKSGVDVDSTAEGKLAALCIAALYAKEEAVNHLIKSGANVSSAIKQLVNKQREIPVHERALGFGIANSVAYGAAKPVVTKSQRRYKQLTRAIELIKAGEKLHQETVKMSAHFSKDDPRLFMEQVFKGLKLADVQEMKDVVLLKSV
jgi:hypothetical protein